MCCRILDEDALMSDALCTCFMKRKMMTKFGPLRYRHLLMIDLGYSEADFVVV